MTPWSIFRKVKSALDEEDIEGLLVIGSPSDEYEGEASLIENEIAKLTNFGERALAFAQVEEIIARVWNDRFGPFNCEDLNKRRSAFSSVARKIATQ